MHTHHLRTLRAFLLGGAALLAAPAIAADVTPQRLANPEPGNWLMNHRTYDAQRYSPLDRINKTNVKNLKLAYAVAIGGTSANENLQSTPLAEDGFLYVDRSVGRALQDRRRSGDVGPHRVAHGPRPGEAAAGEPRRRAVGQFRRSRVASYPPRVIATNKETGKVVWETNMADGQADVQLTAAPLAVKDKIIVGAVRRRSRRARFHRRRSTPRPARCCGANTRSPRPASPAARPGRTRTTPGRPAAAPCGSRVPTMSPPTRCCGAPAIRCRWSDPYYRPGDNLYTNSLISWDPDTGKMNWYHQYTPGDMWDYDEAGSHILIDGSVAGQPHKLVTHAARNGFLYSLERANGQTAAGEALRVERSPGPRASTRRPASRSITIPSKDIQVYSGRQNMTVDGPDQETVPVDGGGNNYLAGRPTARRPGCSTSRRLDVQRSDAGSGIQSRSGVYFRADVQERRARRIRDHRVADPLTGEVKKRAAHALSEHTAARCRPPAAWCSPASRDGTFVAYDDTTMEPAVEDQCRHRLQRAADDLRGRRQAVCRHPVGLSRITDDAHVTDAGTARHAQPDHAVRLRAVSL